jgi:hypothetical protein
VFRDVLVEILCMMEGGPTAWVQFFGCRHPEMVVRKRACAKVVRTAASGFIGRARKML